MDNNSINTKKTDVSRFALITIFISFFVMGFIDLIGISTSHIQHDFKINNTEANFLTSMVFIWFLVLSVPTSILMNRIGRKRVVLISLLITALALFIPYIAYNMPGMILCFSLIGVGNTLMQVSSNPLLSEVVNKDKLSSMLTFGQFIKAIASFVAPIIAYRTTLMFGDWKLVFLAYAVIAIVAILLLNAAEIKEDQVVSVKTSGFSACFRLLADSKVLICFVGIICHVGIDVGSNVTAPKILIERLGFDIAEAGFACSVYFFARLIGCFIGAISLSKMSQRLFYLISLGTILLGCITLLFADSASLIYGAVALIGIGNSNIFSIIFSQSIQYLPTKKNEISGLMIMGLCGGGLFALLMGIAADMLKSQVGAVLILLLGASYLLFMNRSVKR